VSVRFLADADLDYAIVQGVRRREPSADFKSSNEAGLEGLSDDKVLELAASEGRVLVTHDTSSMPIHFANRRRSGLGSPGVLLALQKCPIGQIVESLLIVWSASGQSDWADQIHYLPSFSRHRF
jgi:hypothetical protein